MLFKSKTCKGKQSTNECFGDSECFYTASWCVFPEKLPLCDSLTLYSSQGLLSRSYCLWFPHSFIQFLPLCLALGPRNNSMCREIKQCRSVPGCQHHSSCGHRKQISSLRVGGPFPNVLPSFCCCFYPRRLI